MADQPKQPWYKSIPGILTAATGFIAALSGLVAGLNQFGAFRREPPAEVVVGTAPAPADNTAQAEDSTAARSATSPQSDIPPSAPPPTAAPRPAPATRPARSSTSTSDTAGSRSLVIPKGTAILLTVASRTCAPAEGSRRFTARVASPVEVDGVTVLPTGSAAALRLRRAGDSPVPRARLDSLVRSGRALPVSSAQVQVPRASVGAGCLKPGGHLTVVLGGPVTVGGS